MPDTFDTWLEVLKVGQFIIGQNFSEGRELWNGCRGTIIKIMKKSTPNLFMPLIQISVSFHKDINATYTHSCGGLTEVTRGRYFYFTEDKEHEAMNFIEEQSFHHFKLLNLETMIETLGRYL